MQFINPARNYNVMKKKLFFGRYARKRHYIYILYFKIFFLIFWMVSRR